MRKNFTLSFNGSFPFVCMLFFFASPGLVNAQAPSLTFVSRISGLNTPVDIVNAGDNTNRLFIVSQKNATIQVYTHDYIPLGTLLTVSDVRTTGSEEGLLSIAFHPDYETNRLFFVYYTNTSGDLELARYQTTLDPLVADPASKTIILTIPHPIEQNHNGGKLNFGPDGYLYFATGDGGSGGDPGNDGQTGTTLLGKMLRINVNPGAGTPYAIPPGNPYTNTMPDDNIRDEIWAFGLRNPFRWSFDRANGDMWIGDVGQGAWEEVSYRAAASGTGGVNYGWRCFEGNHSYNGCVVLTGPGVYVPPVFEYPNTGGSAVTGGIVYRGTAYPSLVGYYITTDFYSGTKYLITSDGLGGWETATQGGLPDWIAAFGDTENGDTAYALSLRGVLYKIVATPQAPTPVTLVSFGGIQKNGGVELTWETQNEINVRQYEIEYGINGTVFELAGKVTADNSATYRFHHNATSGSKLSYRLKILDNDGKFEYSKIIQVNRSESNQGNFVRPSLITNKVLNLVIQEGYQQIQLINLQGRVLWQQNMAGRTGNVRFSLPVLLPGNYIVRLFGSEKSATQRIMVQ